MNAIRITVLVILTSLPATMPTTSDAQGRDVVAGQVEGVFCNPVCISPAVATFNFTATSEVGGDNPRGRIILRRGTEGENWEVTCLIVDGNSATIIGSNPTSVAPDILIVTQDNAENGDTFFAFVGTFSPACESVGFTSFALVSGDVMVHDAQ